ncbi:hypothetical protein [Arcobacter sp. LA11]|uniref:hypothetical protein n=1 Tax=Arcobacter sp. LA11 TaxID=1898176 RepID=UPI00093537E0|nr:hypothetical protein [Arcobacter sp. LA11]
MKKTIYQIIIVILITSLGYILYQLNTESETSVSEIKKEKKIEKSILDIREKKKNIITNYKSKEIDVKNLDDKLFLLNTKLEETNNMLEKENIIKNSKSIKEKEIEELKKEIQKVRENIEDKK